MWICGPSQDSRKHICLSWNTFPFLPLFVGLEIELIELRYSSNINSMIPKQNNVHIVHVTEIEEERVGWIRSFAGYGIFYKFFPLVKYDLCPPPLTLQPRYFKYYPRSGNYPQTLLVRDATCPGPLCLLVVKAARKVLTL